MHTTSSKESLRQLNLGRSFVNATFYDTLVVGGGDVLRRFFADVINFLSGIN